MTNRVAFPDGNELCRYIREMSGGTAILAFSGGKDALCAYLRLREHFERIVLYYLYLVPDLEFVERGLRYYEDALGVSIHRMPHPSLYRMIRNLVFQPPEHIIPILGANLPRLTLQDIYDDARQIAGDANTWIATGVRAADSPIRRVSVNKHGPLSHRNKTFMPVFDYRMDDVVTAIQQSGLSLTEEYRLFGRTFDGIDYRFLAPIKKQFPDDYRRILEWFPLAELELKRREFAARRNHA